MPRPRVSIRNLMLGVAAVGLACGALCQPSAGWALLLCSVHATILLTAVLGAVFQRGRARVAWTGFALFGWAFVVAALTAGQINSLATYSIIAPMEFLAVLSAEEKPAFGNVMQNLRHVDESSRLAVVSSVTGLLFALLGAGIARLFGEDAHGSAPSEAPGAAVTEVSGHRS